MQKHGFTLIELLLFMALFSIILGVLLNLFSVIVDTQMEVQSTSAVENDSKFIVSRLMYDIQRAQSITIPTNLGDESASLTLSIDGTTFQYAVQDGNLTVTAGGVTDNVNSMGTQITALRFTRLGNDGGKNSVQVAFTIESRNPSVPGEETKTINTVIGLR